jgi:hypothetical protein
MSAKYLWLRSGSVIMAAALLAGLLSAVAEAADGETKISLDSAVLIGNRAIAETRVSGKFNPLRVEIAEESERYMANRCLVPGSDDPPAIARVYAIREKLADRKYYVLRYGPPLEYEDPKEGRLSFFWDGGLRLHR